MFVGHGLLAFAIVAGLAHERGVGRDRALAVGLLAAAFATVPDVDVLHPLFALAVAPVPIGDAPAAFWALSTAVHRTVTHSLVVGTVAALGVTAWAARRDARPSRWHDLAGPALAAGGLAALVGLVALVWILDGTAAAAVMAAMALAGLVLARVALRHGLGVGQVGAAALVGLLSHPFGDLLTGQPPPLFYPLGVELELSRVSLHPDATLHLLGAFLVELATVWLALAVLARLSDVHLAPHVGRRSFAGFGYAGAVLVLPAPSLDAATAFVFSLVAVGLVGVPVRRAGTGTHGAWRAITTALAAVTLAALAYGLAYVAL